MSNQETTLMVLADVNAIREGKIKNLTLRDFCSMLHSLEFYIEKNIEFDEYIDELEEALCE